MGKKHRRSGYPLNRLKDAASDQISKTLNKKIESKPTLQTGIHERDNTIKIDSRKAEKIDIIDIPKITLDVLGHEKIQQMSKQQIELLDQEIKRILLNKLKTD